MHRRILSVLIAASLPVLMMAPAQAANGNDGVTQAVMACIKRALPPDQVALVEKGMMNKLPPASASKAMTCFYTDGKASSVKVAKGKFIAVSPIDLTRVTGVSKFRSCMGHDYSGMNLAGKPEQDRSMKHYVFTDIPLTEVGAMDGLAPFDGTVKVEDEEGGFGKHVTVTNIKLGWMFIFFHAEPVAANGSTVKAGQKVVSFPPVSPAGAEPGQTDSFDLGLRSLDGRYDSFLSHMTPAALAPWNAKGFTVDRTVMSQAQRDANPCNGNYSGAMDHPDLVRPSS